MTREESIVAEVRRLVPDAEVIWRNGTHYHGLGDKVRVKIKRADLAKKQLDFEMVGKAVQEAGM